MKINRYYNTLATYKEQLIKHVPPANKEWKNSVYSYNKNLLKDTALKDDNTYDIMKGYLNSYFFKNKNVKNLRSMRMRSYIRRSSTKRVFVSKPDIKQTTNKAIITLYVFDRENQLLKSNIFTLDKLLKNNNSIFSNSSFLKENISFKKSEVKNKNSFNKYSKNIINYNLLPKLIMPSIINKQTLLKDFFIYSFIVWILQKNFGIKINTYKYCNKCKIETTNKKAKEFCSNCGKNFKIDCTKLVIFKDNNEIFFINKFKFKNIKMVNVLLSKYLNSYLTKLIYSNKAESINSLFYNFVTIKKTFFIKKILKKEYNVLDYFTKLNSSNFKYTTLLSNIKNFVTNLYLKNIEFNLVNLKYLHLNSDIFMEALAIKLRKKLSLLEVLKRSLYLVKRPSKFSGMLEKKDSLYNKNLSILPNNVLDSSLLRNKNLLDLYNFTTINNILNSLKYKWVSGIRLEAKGRLTKRYTASRAVFKYITRGNLRNLDKLYNTEFDTATPNIYLTRNQFKPNLQHTYVYSNKRIGTFGLKGWINSV